MEMNHRPESSIERKGDAGGRAISLINPYTGLELWDDGEALRDAAGQVFPKVAGAYRLVRGPNYTDSFGFQWNKFDRTQIDSEAQVDQSRQRLLGETGWPSGGLRGERVLEVGSGAGRFTRVVLEQTEATLYSVDFSSAVEANFRNNGRFGARLRLFQASIYELPFAPGSFDRVFCFGVLQHTPDFSAAVRALIAMARPGGEIVVDFYPIKGWWTKISAKYLLRPITKKMSHARLHRLIEGNIDWLIRLYFLLHRLRLSALTRFLPICDIGASFPKNLGKSEMREWAVLDTFDMYSPEHDHPQRIKDVASMFARHGAEVTFAGFREIGEGRRAAVVAGRRK